MFAHYRLSPVPLATWLSITRSPIPRRSIEMVKHQTIGFDSQERTNDVLSALGCSCIEKTFRNSYRGEVLSKV